MVMVDDKNIQSITLTGECLVSLESYQTAGLRTE